MMNKTIQQITKKLIKLLPENEQYYLLDELRLWGFPPFLVERIQVELERNLAESMVLPDTDWANTRSDVVVEAWQQFVRAILDEARLPASYAKAVIETAVADTLDALIQPRKNIPDIIFGNDDELKYDQLCDRIKAVAVYPHFATLVPRYMQRKELDVLTRERCAQIIGRADERLTANYSPLNWAQTLDPLFDLLDGRVDPSMMRLFFEDKGRGKLARMFDRRDELLTRAEFIEALSSPEWDEPEKVSTHTEPENHAAKTETEEPAAETEPEEGTGEKVPEEQAGEASVKREERDVAASGDPQEPAPVKAEDSQPEQEDSPEITRSDTNSAAAAEPEETVPEEAQEGKELFIRTQGLPPKKARGQGHNHEDPPARGLDREEGGDGDDYYGHSDESEAGTLNAAFGWGEELLSQEEEGNETGVEPEETAGEEAVAGPSPVRKVPADEEVNVGEEEEEEDEDGGDKPIWMNFMSSEEKEALGSEPEEEEPELISNMDFEAAGGLPQKDEGNYYGGGDYDQGDYDQGDYDGGDYIDSPLINIAEDDPVRLEVRKLKEQLSVERSRFIRDIFGGAKREYEMAIEEVGLFHNWQSASKYIQKEIFQRNEVDMYSESAIDFTDRLHNYFTGKKD